MQGGMGDVFLPGADDHLVDAAAVGLAGLAEAAGEAGQVLQFEGDVFQDVTGPSPFLHPRRKPPRAS